VTQLQAGSGGCRKPAEVLFDALPDWLERLESRALFRASSAESVGN
jgi:hypothetical protein